MQIILKDLWRITRLRNTINTNLILYGIRRIPIIGGLFNDDIYGIKLFKIIAFILSIQAEIFKAVFGDFCMFALLAMGTFAINYGTGCPKPVIFLYGFIVASLVNVFNFEIFKGSLEADYAVFGMGMDAKKFIMARLTYRIAWLIISYVLFGIPAAFISGVPWFVALLIPLAGMGFDIGALALKMWIFSLRQKGFEKNNKKKDISIEGTSTLVFLLVFGILMLGFAGIPVIVRLEIGFIPYIFYAIVFFVAITTFFTVKAIGKFPYGYYRIALAGEKVKLAKEKEKNKKANSGTAQISKDITRINQGENVNSELKGYAYLNDIFFKRHKNILSVRLLLMTLLALGVVFLGSFLIYLEVFKLHAPEKSVIRGLFTRHAGVILPAVWSLNYTDYICHVMFANCDSVMLKYNFYKSPDALVMMYKERLISVIRANSIPAIIVAIFSVVSVLVTGGEETPFQCIFNVVLVGTGLVAASAWYLSIYYLVQPYASNLQVKSKLYSALNFVISALQFLIIFIPIPAWILCLVCVPGTLLAIYVFMMLIRVISPKTFKIR